MTPEQATIVEALTDLIAGELNVPADRDGRNLDTVVNTLLAVIDENYVSRAEHDARVTGLLQYNNEQRKETAARAQEKFAQGAKA